jgi:hypothetical protein
MMPLVVLGGLALAGYALRHGATWQIVPAHTRLARERAEALWLHAIVDLVVRSVDGDERDLPVVVVGLRDATPTGLYTGSVLGSNGTTFKEGAFVEFGPEHVTKIEA